MNPLVKGEVLEILPLVTLYDLVPHFPGLGACPKQLVQVLCLILAKGAIGSRSHTTAASLHVCEQFSMAKHPEQRFNSLGNHEFAHISPPGIFYIARVLGCYHICGVDSEFSR